MLQIAVQRRTAATFEEDLRDFIDKYSFWWDDTSAEPPSPGALFTRSLQESNEAAADRLAGYLEEEFTNFPAGAGKQSLWRERLFIALRRFGRECFAFPDRDFDIIFSPEYLEVTRAFAHRAQAFDESIEPQSLAQALRNVWVMNWQQLFLGARPSLTHSVFAYSLLYPYTDNLLDLPGLSRAAKEEACSRLAYRLAGNQMNPANVHEASVFRLRRSFVIFHLSFAIGPSASFHECGSASETGAWTL